jgi:hexosaminidase
VRGDSNYKVHWLGWEGIDFTLILDLEIIIQAKTIEISSLWDSKRWILHPEGIRCLVSDNGKDFTEVGNLLTEGNQQKEEVSKVFSFIAPQKVIRYVKFEIKGTKQLPQWHPSAGSKSWVFMDEIVVR